MTPIAEKQLNGFERPYVQREAPDHETISEICPECKARGYQHSWGSHGLVSVVRYLCTNTSCPRARMGWYKLVVHTFDRPGDEAPAGLDPCPVCFEPVLAIYPESRAPALYVHKVAARNASNPNDLTVVKACAVEMTKSYPVGTGG